MYDDCGHGDGKTKEATGNTTCGSAADLPTSAAHPFYQRVNPLLDAHDFDDFVEAQCQPFYAETMGRPSLPPGDLFPAAVGRLLRRAGLGTRHRVAGRRFAGLARFSRASLCGRAAGPLDDFAHAAPDRSGDASGGVHLGAATARRGRAAQRQDGRRSTRRRSRPMRRCAASCDATRAKPIRTF